MSLIKTLILNIQVSLNIATLCLTNPVHASYQDVQGDRTLELLFSGPAQSAALSTAFG